MKSYTLRGELNWYPVDRLPDEDAARQIVAEAVGVPAGFVSVMRIGFPGLVDTSVASGAVPTFLAAGWPSIEFTATWYRPAPDTEV